MQDDSWLLKMIVKEESTVQVISNLKIGTRLSLGFGLVLLSAIVLLALGLLRMNELRKETELIVNNKTAGLIKALDMREQGWSLTLVLRKIATPTDAMEVESESGKLAQILDRYAKSEDDLKSIIIDPQGKSILSAAVEQKEAVLSAIQHIKNLVNAGNYFDGALALKKDFLPLHEKWMSTLAALAEHQQKDVQSTYEASGENYKITQAEMLIQGLLMVVFGALIAWFITRTITVPLQRAAHIADAVAKGDLSETIEANTRDEAGQLVNSLKTMQSNLVDTVNRIKQGTDTIAFASSEIVAGNADLSSHTERQASSLQETASSMEELTATVKQNAEHAQQANELAESASGLASRGGKVVGNVVDTMGSIKESSRKIVEIIGVIDGIAFQTNILALNAAVEAARAGEEGRGFAVVAAEVRNLARMSATAAKEIKALINESVDSVEAGARFVDEAGNTMREIVTSVRRVADIVDEITIASQEQSAGIGEVNKAVAQMDEMTQKNAVLVEQATAAAASMQEQVTMLTQAVAMFNLGGAAWVGSTIPPQRCNEPYMSKAASVKLQTWEQKFDQVSRQSPPELKLVSAASKEL